MRAGPVSVGALAGKRILITRAREQAEKTAGAIRARGAEAVLLPAIELHPPADPAAVSAALVRARAGAYGWVVFTSENGVEWTWRALAEGAGGGVLGGAKVAAIGPATAAALEKRAVAVDLLATESKGEGLARALLDAIAPGESVLLLRAQVARDILPDALRAAGHAVDVVAVYETRPASGPDVAAVLDQLGRGAIDVITFTSGSTVDSFVALTGGKERAVELLDRVVVASIGPITSEALLAHGLRIDVVPGAATLDALLDAIEAHLAALPA